MARTFSQTWTDAMYASETGECPLCILEISGGGLASTIRLVNNTEDIISNGNTYTAFPFMIELPPEETDQKPPSSRIQIDNVSRDYIQEIRELTSAPTVKAAFVLSSDPDTVEAGWWEFTLHNVSYDRNIISGDLGYEKILDELFPSGRMSPARFPGLY